MNNLILDSDSYKLSHWLQFPPGTTSMFSYLESRGGRYTHTAFFGLQMLIKKYLMRILILIREINIRQVKQEQSIL